MSEVEIETARERERERETYRESPRRERKRERKRVLYICLRIFNLSLKSNNLVFHLVPRLK